VESRTLETPPSPPTRPSRTILTGWLQGTTLRSPTWRSRKLKTTTLKTRTIIAKNNHAESKKIAVKVFGERTRTEETNVKKQNAGNTALTALQNIKNKIPNVFPSKDKFGKNKVKMLIAEHMTTINT
jgi:hypothetical protein